MIFVNITMILLFVLGYAASMKGAKEWELTIDRKEHKLFFLYPMANLILIKTGLYKHLCKREKVTNSIKALHVTSKPELIQRLYWCSEISLVISILFLFSILSLMSQLEAFNNTTILDGKYLIRPGYGEGREDVDLSVTLEQSNQKTPQDDNKTSYSEDLTIQIEEQGYGEEQLAKAFEQAKQYLNLEVLGKNEDFDLIYEDLIFSNHIPGTSISVEWKPEDYNLIHPDGSINNEDISPKGVTTEVNAILTYGDEQIDYRLQFCIMPRKYSEEELIRKTLEKEIEMASERTAEDERLELPVVIEDYQLNWADKDQKTGITMLFMGLLTAVFAWMYGEKELEQKMKKRKEQMLLDYPEIINKFTLLVNAGMTVKQAWSKITEDYEKKDKTSQSKKRYAYEEMLVTVRELKLGVPESIAFEQFGRRVGLLSYIKFGSLIAQNIKKGSKGLSELLSKEASEAFEERKELAKRLGEEAGTKLLAPMMIMLLIVFIIILIPAFRSFGV